MVTSNLFFFLMFTAGLLKISTNECIENEILPCREDLEKFLTHPPFYYAQTNETLNELCKKQKMMVQCIEDNAKTCLNDEDQRVFRMMTQGLFQFMAEFCSPRSKLRMEYLKHASCIQTVTEDFNKCYEELRVSENEIEKEILTHDATEDIIHRTCCIYYRNIQCSADATQQKCGEDASFLTAELFTKMGGSYLSEMCEQHASTCSSGALRSEPSLYVVFFLTTSFLKLISFVYKQ